jgi:YegS/Rv2252/BmrU family lipid kinase
MNNNIAADIPIKKKHFLLVFNKSEGRSKAERRLQEIIRRLSTRSCTFEVVESKELAERNDFSRFDSVVAIGGDGTVLSVLQLISRHEVKLGIIPCGTANLLAAGLSIPTNIDRAIDILFTGKSSRIDIGKAGEQYFALRVGVGYDADIVNGAGSYLKDKLGYLAYFIEGVKNSFKLSLKKMKVTIDGETFYVKANSIIVANVGNMFRNFVTIAPDCSTSDGKLDVFILRSRNFMDFLFVLCQIIFRRHHSTPSVMYGQGSNIEIESLDIDNHTHIDGEPSSYKKLTIEVIPKALSVLVPSPIPEPAFEKVYIR